MTSRLKVMLLTGSALVLALPAMAFAAAAEEGPHSQPMYFSLLQFGSGIAVFLIAFFVLKSAAWPKILGGLDDREKKIRSEIFAAEEARKKAAEAQKEFERSLAQAKNEAQRMIDDTRAEQARLAADLKLKAEAELTQMREAAMRDIDAAKRSAISDIYGEAATLATTVASKILKREVNVNDQKHLVAEAMAEVKREFARA